jgi:hypothetical protein
MSVSRVQNQKRPLALRKRDELLGLLRPCFCPDRAMAAGAQVYVGAGQRVAQGERVEYRPHGRDRTPDRTQRLLNHASWDTLAAMSVVRRFAAEGMQEAARRGRRGGLVIGAIDETGQESQGSHRGSPTPVPGVARARWRTGSNGGRGHEAS